MRNLQKMRRIASESPLPNFKSSFDSAFCQEGRLLMSFNNIPIPPSERIELW